MLSKDKVNDILSFLTSRRQGNLDKKLINVAQQIIRERTLNNTLPHWVDLASERQIKMFTHLLEEGANPNALITTEKGNIPLLHAIADASPECAIRLIERGAPIDQTLFNVATHHARNFASNQRDHRAKLLGAIDQSLNEEEKRQQWNEIQAIEAEFPWAKMLETFIQSPNIQWYKPVIKIYNEETSPHEKKPTCITYWRFHCQISNYYKGKSIDDRIQEGQRNRGEHVGRPPLPETLTPEQINRLFEQAHRNNTGELLSNTELYERRIELLNRGADPNTLVPGWNWAESMNDPDYINGEDPEGKEALRLSSIPKKNSIHGGYPDHSRDKYYISILDTLLIQTRLQRAGDMAYLDMVINAGGKPTKHGMKLAAEHFIRHAETTLLQRRQDEASGDPNKLNYVKRSIRWLEDDKKSFIAVMGRAETAGQISVGQIEHGKIAEKLEELFPGIMAELDFGTLMANTAAAKKSSQKNKPTRL